MDFAEIIASLDRAALGRALDGVSTAKVRRTLALSRLTPADAPIVFSAAALELLEPLAQRAQAITRARFGRTMTLYAPLYLSNHCVNRCTYCDFAADADTPRTRLEPAEAVVQAALLRSQGIRHLLLVTGEAPSLCGVGDIARIARVLRPQAASLAVEIFPSDRAGYEQLAAAGVDSLVLYQETYDPGLYARHHPAGPKRDFARRLRAIEAGGEAGLRSLGIGALLGLGDARLEACLLALHADHLGRRFPGARLAVSFPRLRPIRRGFAVPVEVPDAVFAQLIIGMRLLFPDAELVLSTREAAPLRDRLMHLGITRMSAGSRTSPGGYSRSARDDEAGQFSVSDRRSVAEVAAAVQAAGFDAVFKDFDTALLGGAP